MLCLDVSKIATDDTAGPVSFKVSGVSRSSITSPSVTARNRTLEYADCDKKCICARSQILLNATVLAMDMTIKSFEMRYLYATLDCFAKIATAEMRMELIKSELRMDVQFTCRRETETILGRIKYCVGKIKLLRNEVIGMFLTGTVTDFFDP